MITPVDIENKVFKKSKFGGYDIGDVEDFLEQLIVDYEALYKENGELKDKINVLQESIAYYKSLEEGINQTIEKAQTSAEDIKENALKEVETIKYEKETELKDTLEDLKEKIRRKETEYEEKKKLMDIYKIKVNSMLEAQLKILNEIDE